MNHHEPPKTLQGTTICWKISKAWSAIRPFSHALMTWGYQNKWFQWHAISSTSSKCHPQSFVLQLVAKTPHCRSPHWLRPATAVLLTASMCNLWLHGSYQTGEKLAQSRKECFDVGTCIVNKPWKSRTYKKINGGHKPIQEPSFCATDPAPLGPSSLPADQWPRLGGLSPTRWSWRCRRWCPSGGLAAVCCAQRHKKAADRRSSVFQVMTFRELRHRNNTSVPQRC